MLGVVLWSDSDENKAVIWCEDQGDLAYFNGGQDTPDAVPDLDAGDLVQFDLAQERHLRYAHNPRLVVQGGYTGIDDGLMHAAQGATHVRREETGAKVVPFVRPRRNSVNADLVPA